MGVSTDRPHRRVPAVSLVWLLLNTVLIVQYSLGGQVDAAALIRTAWILPGLAGGILLGEILHRKVDGHWFRVVASVVLIGIGISLVVQG